MKTKAYLLTWAAVGMITACNRDTETPPTPQTDMPATNSITQTRDEFIAATDKKLNDLDAKIDSLSASIADAAGDVKARMNQEIADLRAQRDSLRQQYDKLKGVNQDVWDKTKADFQLAWNNVVKAYDDTAAKIRNQTSTTTTNAANQTQ